MGPCNGACCSSRRSEPFAGQCHYNMPMRSFWWLRRKVIAFQNTPNAPGPRILFALSSRKRESGYGLVQQVIDPQDGAQDTDVPDRQRQGAGARNSAIGQI